MLKAMQSRKIPTVSFFSFFGRCFAFSDKHQTHSRKQTDADEIGISSPSPAAVRIKSEPAGDSDIEIIQPDASVSSKLQEIRNAFLNGNANANKCGNNLEHSDASPFGAFKQFASENDAASRWRLEADAPKVEKSE